jgi:hypothetical protein
MRRFYLCLVVISFLLTGCSRQWEPSTIVYRSLSLGSIIERMKVPELESMSGDYGGTETKGDTVRRRRDFNLTYRINEREGVKFDEAKFIHQLQAEVEKAIREFDVHIDGNGSSNDTFSIDYSEKGHRGWVDIVTARVEGNQFKLWGVMRENTESEKK